MKFSKLSIILLSCLGFSSLASGHAIWVAKVHGEQAVNYGHSGTNTDDYDPAKLTTAYGFKTDGSKVDVEVKNADNHAALNTDGVALVAAQLNNGYWAQGKDGKWVNKRGDQVEGAESSNQYFKETVAYLNPRVKPQPTGLIFEIVPEVNPATLTEGEDLKVRVLFDGAPVEGAEVSSNYFDSHAASATTDKDGYATVPVVGHAFNIISADHKVTADNPFDGQGHTTTLSFEAKHEHHH